MNDDELITAVRDSFTDVHSATPVGQIMGRSRAIRARRRVPRMAGALAVVAVAVLTMTALIPASHPATARLAAWTVTRQADGSIQVTIRQLRDPAGLQRTLRADGVPASVTFAGQLNPACRLYGSLGPLGTQRHLLDGVLTPASSFGEPTVMVIHPAALPSGAGLQIYALFLHHDHLGLPGRGQLVQVDVALVHTSPRCTGS
jgi:hypothetical protein